MKKTLRVPHAIGTAKKGFHAPVRPLKKKTAKPGDEVFPIVGDNGVRHN